MNENVIIYSETEVKLSKNENKNIVDDKIMVQKEIIYRNTKKVFFSYNKKL